MKYECGTLVRSKAGHDKEELYVVLEERGDLLVLANGSNRTIEHPKQKNKKHVQIIHKKLEEAEWSNEAILHFILAAEPCGQQQNE